MPKIARFSVKTKGRDAEVVEAEDYRVEETSIVFLTDVKKDKSGRVAGTEVSRFSADAVEGIERLPDQT